MANLKISQLTAKSANLEATDVLEIAEDAGGGTYVTKSITGAEIIAASVSTNFANTNLTFTANRTHDLAGYKATLDNAELKVIADANTSGDVPFEVTQADGTTNILKAQGDGKIYVGTSNQYAYIHKGGGTGVAIVASNSGNTGSATYNFGYNAGELYIQGNGDGAGSFIHRISNATNCFDTFQTTSTLAYYQIGRFGNDFKIKSTIGVGLTLEDSITVKQTTGDVIIGNNAALATNATGGFLQVPSCAGTPTGVPTVETGKIPLVADSTNNKLYIYSGGSWVALN